MPALPCIVCKTPLENVEDASSNQPEEGLAFETQGHWPSQILDDDGNRIEISVCNPCISAQLQSGVARMISTQH